MTNFLQQEFKIHPVGQGLFYSGKITHDNKVKFRMVFDCGSINKKDCNQEVYIYRDSDFLDEKIIDLLIISHFDGDHINMIENLLHENIKIKKLVMPFLTFEERLFLVLRYFSDESPKVEDDFFIRFALDPLNTISDNLDDDSQVFVIESGPNEPINDDGFIQSENNDSKNRFKFGFKDAEKISPNRDVFTSNTEMGIFKTNDSKKGILFNGMLKLMEFIFYRKKVHDDEKFWYDKITDIFYEDFKIDRNLPDQELLNVTLNEIKKIKSSSKIKEIFTKAKKAVGNIKGDLKNLNTTALCMLHKNLPDIFELGHNAGRNFYHNIIVNSIHKFESSRIENTVLKYSDYYWNFHEYDRSSIFPNVLLTSDIFLLKKNDVDQCMRHYKNYWNNFWLFQIPHHGSEKSSDDLLYSNLVHTNHCFINYGIGNRDKHPNTKVIQDLVKTGNSSKIIPVNQIVGLCFALSISFS